MAPASLCSLISVVVTGSSGLPLPPTAAAAAGRCVELSGRVLRHAHRQVAAGTGDRDAAIRADQLGRHVAARGVRRDLAVDARADIAAGRLQLRVAADAAGNDVAAGSARQDLAGDVIEVDVAAGGLRI